MVFWSLHVFFILTYHEGKIGKEQTLGREKPDRKDEKEGSNPTWKNGVYPARLLGITKPVLTIVYGTLS